MAVIDLHTREACDRLSSAVWQTAIVANCTSSPADHQQRCVGPFQGPPDTLRRRADASHNVAWAGHKGGLRIMHRPVHILGCGMPIRRHPSTRCRCAKGLG